MPVRIFLLPEWYALVEASPLIFNGWQRLGEGFLEMDFPSVDGDVVYVSVMQQVRDLFQSLNQGGKYYLRNREIGEILFPNGSKMPILS